MTSPGPAEETKTIKTPCADTECLVVHQENPGACRKDKNIKNPLWLIQNVSCEPLMLRPVENP